MILTLVTAYAIIGLILGLIVWHSVFDEGYDNFVRYVCEEEPPTTKEKWRVILITPFIWPYSLYKGFFNV